MRHILGLILLFVLGVIEAVPSTVDVYQLRAIVSKDGGKSFGLVKRALVSPPKKAIKVTCSDKSIYYINLEADLETFNTAASKMISYEISLRTMDFLLNSMFSSLMNRLAHKDVGFLSLHNISLAEGEMLQVGKCVVIKPEFLHGERWHVFTTTGQEVFLKDSQGRIYTDITEILEVGEYIAACCEDRWHVFTATGDKEVFLKDAQGKIYNNITGVLEVGEYIAAYCEDKRWHVFTTTGQEVFLKDSQGRIYTDITEILEVGEYIAAYCEDKRWHVFTTTGQEVNFLKNVKSEFFSKTSHNIDQVGTYIAICYKDGSRHLFTSTGNEVVLKDTRKKAYPHFGSIYQLGVYIAMERRFKNRWNECCLFTTVGNETFLKDAKGVMYKTWGIWQVGEHIIACCEGTWRIFTLSGKEVGCFKNFKTNYQDFGGIEQVGKYIAVKSIIEDVWHLFTTQGDEVLLKDSNGNVYGNIVGIIHIDELCFGVRFKKDNEWHLFKAMQTAPMLYNEAFVYYEHYKDKKFGYKNIFVGNTLFILEDPNRSVRLFTKIPASMNDTFGKLSMSKFICILAFCNGMLKEGSIDPLGIGSGVLRSYFSDLSPELQHLLLRNKLIPDFFTKNDASSSSSSSVSSSAYASSSSRF